MSINLSPSSEYLYIYCLMIEFLIKWTDLFSRFVIQQFKIDDICDTTNGQGQGETETKSKGPSC